MRSDPKVYIFLILGSLAESILPCRSSSRPTMSVCPSVCPDERCGLGNYKSCSVCPDERWISETSTSQKIGTWGARLLTLACRFLSFYAAQVCFSTVPRPLYASMPRPLPTSTNRPILWLLQF